MKTITLLSMSLFAMSSFAATSGHLNLKGKVPSILAITVTQDAIATTLPLDISQTLTKVASVREQSNSGTGYKVTISSANNGTLVRTSGTEIFPYSLSYDGSPVNLSSPEVRTHGVAAVDVTKDVKITYTGVPFAQLIAGTYTDTVTFSIAVN